MNEITNKTKKINEAIDNVMGKLISTSGMGLFTNLKGDAEAVLLKDCMVLIKDAEELMDDYAVALDKINVLEKKIDTLTELIEKMGEKK